MSKATRKNFGNSHAYYVDGQKIPGVTGHRSTRTSPPS